MQSPVAKVLGSGITWVFLMTSFPLSTDRFIESIHAYNRNDVITAHNAGAVHLAFMAAGSGKFFPMAN